MTQPNSILFRCAQALEQSPLAVNQADSDRPGVSFWQLSSQEQFNLYGVLLKRYYRYPAGEIELFSKVDGTTTLYIDIIDGDATSDAALLGYTIWNFGDLAVHNDQACAPVSSAISAYDFQHLLNCLPLHQLLHLINKQLDGLICDHLRDLIAQGLQACTVIGSSDGVPELHRDLLDKIVLADMP